MQIKTTLRYNLSPVRMAIIKKSGDEMADQEQLRTAASSKSAEAAAGNPQARRPGVNLSNPKAKQSDY